MNIEKLTAAFQSMLGRLFQEEDAHVIIQGKKGTIELTWETSQYSGSFTLVRKDDIDLSAKELSGVIKYLNILKD